MFRLNGFVQVTQPLVCLHILFSKPHFFYVTVFKSNFISQSVLTWLKGIIDFFLRNIRNAVSILAALQAGNFFISCSMHSNLGAD